MSLTFNMVSGNYGDIPTPTEKTVSGAVVHITDALRKPAIALSTAINPVQDLHGYDNPWPAGGSKNLFDGTFLQGYWAYASGAWTASNVWIATGKIPCEPSTQYTVSADEKLTRWQGFVWYDANGNFISTDNLQSNINIGLTKTSPQNAAFMAFNIAGYPNSSSTISPSDVSRLQIEKGASATSYVPYSNICPITGFTGANIYNDPVYAGFIDWNQIFPNKSASYTGEGFTIIGNNDGTFTITVTASSVTSNQYNITSFASSTFTAGHKYIILTNDSRIAVLFKAYSATSPKIFTASTASYTNVAFDFANLPQGTYTVYPMLFDLTKMFGAGNEPSTVAEFTELFPNDHYVYNEGEATCVSAVNGDPYTLIPISFGTAGTVYVGTLDVVNGTLTVTHGQIASYAGETLPGAWISDRDAYVVGTTPTTGAQVVYELASEQTYTLTPTEVQLLLGTNNVWSDTNGDTTLTYLADGNVSASSALNMLLGGTYTPSADVSDREALNIIMGDTT